MKVFGREVKQDKFKSFEEHSNNEIECFFRCKKTPGELCGLEELSWKDLINKGEVPSYED